jgi:hypothetical protein
MITVETMRIIDTVRAAFGDIDHGLGFDIGSIGQSSQRNSQRTGSEQGGSSFGIHGCCCSPVSRSGC